MNNLFLSFFLMVSTTLFALGKGTLIAPSSSGEEPLWRFQFYEKIKGRGEDLEAIVRLNKKGNKGALSFFKERKRSLKKYREVLLGRKDLVFFQEASRSLKGISFEEVNRSFICKMMPPRHLMREHLYLREAEEWKLINSPNGCFVMHYIRPANKNHQLLVEKVQQKIRGFLK